MIAHYYTKEDHKYRIVACLLIAQIVKPAEAAVAREWLSRHT
jgi:hypothetical protein